MFIESRTEPVRSIDNPGPADAARRKAEEALALLDTMLANLPVGFAFLDKELRYLRINELLAALNQVPLEAHLGRTVAEVLPSGLREWIELQLRRVLDTGEPVVFQHAMPHPLRPGIEGHWEVRYYPVRAPGADQEILGLGALVTDITDHVHTEAALREQGRRKDDFLAMLGHELRNPLALIRNAVALLHRHGPPEPALMRERERIDRQVTHLCRLLDDLLDVVRISEGKVVLRREPLDLCALLRTVLQDNAGAMEAAGLRLQTELPPGPVPILGDPVRLAQAVGNLLHNARKFTPAGGEVGVRLVAEGGVARITVRDSGVGIAAETLRRLFSPFVQADTSLDRSQGGLGLGLFLVKGLVAQHGGDVQVRSPGPGQGTEFTIRLPLPSPGEVALPAPPQAEAAPAAAHKDPAPAAGGRRVLIIEDNPDIAESLQELIMDFGHETRIAERGAEGVGLARSFQPDVVLCDIGLPGGMDGYDVARALRSDPALRGIKLIALTGYGQGEDRRRAQEAGFDRHLVKPVDIGLLQSILAA